MKKRLFIEGDNISDIASFYKEINQVFMQNEDWELGESLDALSDMMYGGFGAIKQKEPVELVWHNIEKSRAVLGLAATRKFYEDKLASPSGFNVKLIQERLDALENGEGPTYFEIIMEIIAEHPNIEVIHQ